VSVVPGQEHMVFIPPTKVFTSLPPASASLVNARAVEVNSKTLILDHGDPIPYDFLVLATGTKLVAPGSLTTISKPEGIAYFQSHQKTLQNAHNIVVIGGGAVGIRRSS
jgi:apoptosis-inducing factor 2